MKLTPTTPAVPATPWDPRIVTTFDFRTASAAAVYAAANQARGGRVYITRSGVLHDLTIFVGISSGNISAAIYDLGSTTSGTRTRLWTTGAIACPGAGATIVGDPSLTVSAGQYLEFWLSCDNVTATFFRSSPGAITLPSTYPAPSGGLATPLAFAPTQNTAHPLPTTLPGTLAAGAILPLVTARIV